MATKILPDQPFVLLSGVNPANAIEAKGSGFGLTLKAFDSNFSTPAQQFVLRMQNNVDTNGNVVATGAAFVNLGSLDGDLNNSVTSQAGSQPLLMESYSPASEDKDAWTIAYSGVNGKVGIRIISAADSAWSWNDWSGTGKVGDPIYLYNDQGNNSVWIVKLVPVSQTSDSPKSAAKEATEPVHAK